MAEPNSSVTHYLVSSKARQVGFESRDFDPAMYVVEYQWLSLCLKQRKRVREEEYVVQWHAKEVVVTSMSCDGVMRPKSHVTQGGVFSGLVFQISHFSPFEVCLFDLVPSA